ncbi:hypothetical protein ACE02H_18835 [Shewanella mangrovisoli]|uniref:hypothetical protein n=1 Tax=Shewanella mangrovisoli TaxID=2864211 RepID=UPI0035BB342D
MTKSNLSGIRLLHVNQDTLEVFPTWEYELVIDNMGVSVDLQRLMNHQCDPSKKKVDRQQQIARYAQAFRHEMDRKLAHTTLYYIFLKFKQYLVWCDQNNLYPFTETTLRQYHNYLWELVLIDSSSVPIWQMLEGHTTGVKEITANHIFSATKQALTWCGETAFQWGKQLKQLRGGKVESYEAYSENELPEILSRLSSYFFQLAIPLLSDTPPDMVSVEINQTCFDVSVRSCDTKGRAKGAELDVNTAFNQAMICGYYLLSYFTAFNTSQLTDLCHPIEWREDKTGEYYKLTAFKRRANKEVLSFVGGEIHKKSLQFIQTLIALSLKYNTKDANRKLLYWRSRDGNQRSISGILLGQTELSSRLLLLSDKATQSIPYLMSIHSEFTQTAPKGFVEFDELKFVDRALVKRRKTVRRFYNRRTVALSFALLLAIIKANPKNSTNIVNLKNVVLPLKITRMDEVLKIDFSCEDGGQGSFYVDIQYEAFLARVEAYAAYRQRKQTSAHYLLPLGSERDAIQWQGLAPSMASLADYGIRSGEFFVNLASSRFRETAAKLARRKANRTELHVSQILNNQYRTVLKHYSEGNHYDNQLIISQGLSVIEKMSKGSSLDQSKAKVATDLAISVIKYDELIGSRASLNGVGVACFQKSLTTEESYLAANSTACFDYESCIKCQYAKIINDVEPVYRLLSFLECMEESWLYYPERFSKNLGKAVELYRKVISSSLSPDIIQQAQLKLDTAGRHMLWDNLELSSLGFKGI